MSSDDIYYIYFIRVIFGGEEDLVELGWLQLALYHS